MDAGILTPLLSFGACIALLAALLGVVVASFAWATRLQAYVYYWGLRHFLVRLRRIHFRGEGLNIRPRVLKQLAREEALQLLTGGPLEEPNGRSTVVVNLPRMGTHLGAQIEAALAHPEVMADMADIGTNRQRAKVRRDLLRLVGRVRGYWQLTLFGVAAVAGYFVVAVFPVNSLDLIAGVQSGEAVWLEACCRSSLQLRTASSWGEAVGLVITTLLAAALAAQVVDRVWSRLATLAAAGAQRTSLGAEFFASRQSSSGSARSGADADEEPLIGRDGDYVRAINFSSGGFDTLMHLGVMHALVVLQGRAPDVVTGLSAGAVHAAALAEVLQAGDEAENERRGETLSDEELAMVMRQRLIARVERLREFIEAAHRAPERLLEAVLPDAYQIDVGRPLYPLQQPTFSPEERAQRAEFVSARSGLAALYNDLLSVPLSIGAMTKILRRVLGIVGAGAVQSRLRRTAVYAIESIRLWLLLGAHLVSISRLMPILLRAFRPPHQPNPSTASSLIFRSRLLHALGRRGAHALSFAVLAAVWVILSTFFYPVAVVLAVPLAVAAWRYREDPLIRGVAWEGVQGMFGWLALMAGWLVGAALLYYVTDPQDSVAREGLVVAFGDDWLDLYVRHFVLSFSVTLLLVGLLAWSITTHRWSFHERLLASYNLGDALLKNHGLRAFLSDLFDPEYYPRPSIRKAVKAGLEYSLSCDVPSEVPAQSSVRTLRRYSDQARVPRERMHIAFAVANTETGALEVVPRDTLIVDGLMAATAVTPLLPPVELPVRMQNGHVRKVLYVDAVNVTREPTHALLKILRAHRNPRSKTVYIYSVQPFPISKQNLGEVPPALADDESDEPGSAGSSQRDARKGDIGGSRDRNEYFLNLVDIAWRAWRLRRFRDATLERRLTEFFTAVIPSSVAEITPTSGERYMRAWVTPVELEYDADLNGRLARATKDRRRAIIERTIADGCRAALQVMIPDAISAVAGVMGQPGPGGNGSVPRPKYARCRFAVREYFDTRKGVPESVRRLSLPGSNPDSGPGLAEICASCSIHVSADSRGAAAAKGEVGRGGGEGARRAGDGGSGGVADSKAAGGGNGARDGREADGASVREQTLRLDAWERTGPTWPHELEPIQPTTQQDSQSQRDPQKEPRFKQPDPERRKVLLDAWRHYAATTPSAKLWPRTRDERRPANTRPTISLLFSGGVFRGVFQIGVLNGLHELGVKPDLIAGASVGTITASMIARAFSIELPGKTEAETRVAQQEHIAWLAATYLGIDRLVLTDRFSDFVRNFTLRASETRFSIRQADRVFRRYDYPVPWGFNRDVRHVVAGLERLFYISPYQLNELVRALRTRASKDLYPQISQRVQQFLDRMQIGEEALGAEPLRRLVDEFGVAQQAVRQSGEAVDASMDAVRKAIGDRDVASGRKEPRVVTADDLRDNTGIQFLATTTNLTDGSLEVLGELAASDPEGAFFLNEALLASSAFPGVFRPRWSTELWTATKDVQQYIDGGVMDNFPIDAIAKFLHRAAKKEVGLIARVPPAPHLVVAASLEVSAPRYSLAFTRRRFRTSWIALRERAKQLGYNSKLDTYLAAERALREIDTYTRPRQTAASSGVGRSATDPPSRRSRGGRKSAGDHSRALEYRATESELVHMQLLPIKPNWLCGTFAFHPMLGFRREKQAKSIAHGCAATLLSFAAEHRKDPAPFEHWGIDREAMPAATTWTEAFEHLESEKPDARDGRCWLRDRPCPFSRAYLSRTHPQLPLSVVKHVAAVHEHCLRVESHLRVV